MKCGNVMRQIRKEVNKFMTERNKQNQSEQSISEARKRRDEFIKRPLTVEEIADLNSRYDFGNLKEAVENAAANFNQPDPVPGD
jgi:hypothetical protein